MAEQQGKVLDESDSDLTEQAMQRLQAEAERRGCSIYEVLETLLAKAIS